MANRYEQKGSLSLRSDHMDYGRATLISSWHQARESEPKDHEILSTTQYDPKKRNLHQSTYNRILNVTDGKLPISTCHDSMSQIKLKKDFEEKTLRWPMVGNDSFHETTKPRNLDAPEHGFGSILPRHPTEHNKRYFNTTYGIDYTNINPCRSPPSVEVEEKDYSSAYRKCRSQFTDIANDRREGRNTWHDESGLYANREIKGDVFTKTCPIQDRV